MCVFDTSGYWSRRALTWPRALDARHTSTKTAVAARRSIRFMSGTPTIVSVTGRPGRDTAAWRSSHIEYENGRRGLPGRGLRGVPTRFAAAVEKAGHQR